MAAEIGYELSPELSDADYNALMAAAWDGRRPEGGVLARSSRHSLAHICAYRGERLVGFVNLAWDGGVHAFVLDTTVHPDERRRGVGRELVWRSAEVARKRGPRWLHVDYEPHYAAFYQSCGFRPTEAGLIRLG